MKIYKYHLHYAGASCIQVPAGSKILSVKVQANRPVAYVLFSGYSEAGAIDIVGVETGAPLPYPIERLRYIDTLLFNDGAYVIHYFELLP